MRARRNYARALDRRVIWHADLNRSREQALASKNGCAIQFLDECARGWSVGRIILNRSPHRRALGHFSDLVPIVPPRHDFGVLCSVVPDPGIRLPEVVKHHTASGWDARQGMPSGILEYCHALQSLHRGRGSEKTHPSRTNEAVQWVRISPVSRGTLCLQDDRRGGVGFGRDPCTVEHVEDEKDDNGGGYEYRNLELGGNVRLFPGG
jgi:hypothetical protein